MSEKYNEILEIVNSLSDDVEKFYFKGSLIAGTRLRKGLNQLRRKAKEMRDEIQLIRAERKNSK